MEQKIWYIIGADKGAASARLVRGNAAETESGLDIGSAAEMESGLDTGSISEMGEWKDDEENICDTGNFAVT